MMRKFLGGVLAVAVALSVVAMPGDYVMAEESVMMETGGEAATSYTSGDYRYIINEDGVTAQVTRYLGTESDIVIPVEIDGYKVTVLDSGLLFGVRAESVTIPANVTTIEEGAVYECNIVLEAGNTAYKMEGASVFTMDGKTLIATSVGDTSGVYTIPETVTRVGAYAMASAEYDKIVIPDSVVTIGDYAFWGAEFTEISIGAGVTSIGDYGFGACNLYDKIIVPGNVKTIGEGAFYSGVSEIVLCEGIESIGALAFESRITSITLPASLKSIEGSALTHATFLEKIVVAEGNQNYKLVDNVLYTMDGTTCVAYPRYKSNEEYVVPEGVITIGAHAFYGNKFLKKVTFANTVETIGASAFNSCENLESIVLPGNIKRIEDKTFAYCRKLSGVLLPSEIKFIGSLAFDSCNSLTDVYCVGDEDNWIFKMVQNSTNSIKLHYMGNLKDFVDRMYSVALGRDYDAVGLNGWVRQLVHETHDGAGLAKEFVLGEEFALRNLTDEQYVDTLYATFFNREADAAGKELWLATLKNGATREYVLSQFVNLDEFTLLCADYGINRGVMFEDGSVAAPGLPQFVARLYGQVLGRASDAAGLYNWTNALYVKAVTAEEAAVNFFTSEEYQLKNTDSTTFVTELYSVFMDREADAEGLAFWVSCLEEQGASREWVIAEFAKSAEFKTIAAKYGL